MANIIAIKSEDFAVRIINLARYLREQKQETIISSRYSEVVQVLVQMFLKAIMHKAKVISRIS